ncbi:adenosine deaminase [Agaribacter marinus]|uniref:Adenine deaminase n=1 Tax=Agaribacter marinus TaxID=1431249 RepID=A0AA37WHZ9_9ALTE|nr:adenosine deaminase [Agaribacter marinus]GLR70262.1 adenine deaminase [Agaribacter marinus]
MADIKLLASLPKAELHLHIEGTLEPTLMWALAKKHGITLPYNSVDDIAKAYQFDDLQSFLDLYYQGANVLRDEDDFFQLMWAYLLRCKEDNVVHTEMMIDPQTHTSRGIGFDVFMTGFTRAIEKAKNELGISCYLILSFLRHLSEEDAIETLAQANDYYEDFIAVGLDSSELGNPPEKFVNVFEQARALGFKCVAHAGEEGPPEYVWQALELLKVDRIDHGVRSAEDPKLMTHLAAQKIPLTVCPQSNLKLRVVNDMAEHNILKLLDEGLLVTVNSDDPSYFGGYMNDNFVALNDALSMSDAQMIKLAKHSFDGSFLPETIKQQWLSHIDDVVSNRVSS